MAQRTPYKFVRSAWRWINPYRLRFLTNVERTYARLHTAPTKLLRRNWPASPASLPEKPKVAILAVNFNTAHSVAQLVFSLYRNLGRDQFSRIVIVDNGSTDGSVELLEGLAAARLVHPIFNTKQRYHGPALNQGIEYLSDLQAGSKNPLDETHAIWVLDSDVVVLRDDALAQLCAAMRQANSAMVGEFTYDELAEGYAHPSTLLLDPARVWRREIDPFQEDGSPARAMHTSVRKSGEMITNFPIRSNDYVLHLGSITLQKLSDARDSKNRYLQWAETCGSYHFHGNPRGQGLYANFLVAFKREIPDATSDLLVAACQRGRIGEKSTSGGSCQGCS